MFDLLFKVIQCAGVFIGAMFLLLLWGIVFVALVNWQKRRVLKKELKVDNIVAFYHPFTNAWGGGEKVLFLALCSIAEIVRNTSTKVIVYTVEDEDARSMVSKAAERFNFKLDIEFQLVQIPKRYFTDQHSMVKLSLLSQAIGSAVSVMDAICECPPDIFIDTIGAGFGYPVVKLLCPFTKVVSYTHYPFIQDDMLKAQTVRIKHYYYRGMIFLYKMVGFWADLVMANSSWTQNHLKNLWRSSDIEVVYPPCNTTAFSRIPIETPKKDWIVSFSQFRPEKDQYKQLYAFKLMIEEYRSLNAKFIMIGSCRNADDEKLLNKLRRIAEEENIDRYVEFKLNLPQEEVIDIMAQAKVGIHTMYNEHFGISIVEMMAAGLITIAHSSGGPLYDIIKGDSSRGYLADTPKEYAVSMHSAIEGYNSKKGYQIREKARRIAKEEFSDEVFMDNFERWFRKVFKY